MIHLKPDEYKYIEPLFRNWEETMIWSCLQGIMGQAWAAGPLTEDGRETDIPAEKLSGAPIYTSAKIITGDFCFLAGEPNEELVRHIPADFTSPFLLVVPREEGWYGLIEKCFPDSCQKISRYALKKEKDIFDRKLLESYIERLPAGISLHPIDEELYARILSSGWSRDLCSQFRDAAHFRQLGLGFAALYGEEAALQGSQRLNCNEIAGGASSYTVYDGGIEIEIDVKEDYRRKGVARACAARLILECLDRGLYPSWDAANPESLHLAETLGYHFDREYTTYAVRTQS